MPVYEFSCPQGCEDYEIWRSIDERSVNTQCPNCGTEGKRLFSPPVALCGPLRLKQESHEPKIVRKSSANSQANAKLKTTEGARPWMLNRGC